MKNKNDFSQTWLKLENISLMRGKNQLLLNVTKEINLDGFTLLKGVNGAGKTSFLSMILGLIPPQEGEFSLWGMKVKNALPFLGFMPQKMQETALTLPVREHVLIAFEGHRWGISFSFKKYQKIRDILNRLGVGYLEKCPWGALSGGEKQRVLLAQSIAKKPKLLILDEPLAALDPQARHDIMGLLLKLQQEEKISILMTAHEEFNFRAYFPKMQEICLEGKNLHVTF